MNAAPRFTGRHDDYTSAMREAERLAARLEGFGERRLGRIYTHAIEQSLMGNDEFLRALYLAKTIPVTIDEFMSSREFFKDQMEVWPALLPDIKAANVDVLAGEEPVHEVLLGGATGTGKTAFGHVTNAYQVYCLTCFREPQRLFRLPPATPIVFMFQSVSTTITKRVIYRPFRTMFTSMPYIKAHVNFDKRKESELELEGNIQVVSSLASVEAMVGQAIAGSIVDEINFMTVVENSKQVPGAGGQGGHYDQAELAYRNISRRRKSRFVTRGPSFGILCISSSTRYKGDFLDRRIAEVTDNEEANIIVRRHKQYEMQPKYARPGYETFRYLVGTDTSPGRVLTDDDEEGRTYPEGAVVENIPIDYLPDFRRDPEGSSRDVLGVASLSISPFITQRQHVIASILRTRERSLGSWVVKDAVDLASDGMPQWDEAVLSAIPEAVKRRRWYAHIDLSLTGDRCGIALASVREYVDRVTGEGDTQVAETVPCFDVGCALSIKPSAMAQMDIAGVRTFLMQLKEFFGFNLYMVTYDGFQSFESVRAWRTAGIRSDTISMDKTMEPYKYFRETLYDGRVDIPDNEMLRVELITLEENKTKRKVDHPPRGSKDVADATTGAVFSASKSREVRNVIGYDKNDDGRPAPKARPAGRPLGKDRPQGHPRRGPRDFLPQDKPNEAAKRVDAAREENKSWEVEEERKAKEAEAAWKAIRAQYEG